MKPREYDYYKLFLAYEECRSDNTAHFRKILELQKENEQLQAKLDEAVKALELVAKGHTIYKLNNNILSDVTIDDNEFVNVKEQTLVTHETEIARQALQKIRGEE